MEKVAEVLDRKYPQFNTVSPQHSISDALYQMCCENIDYLIVLENDKFTGILTEHDVANKVLLANKPLTDITVNEFMNRNVPVATSNDSVEYCMQVLDQHNAHHLAIYDRFTFKGVISLYDLMKQTLSKRDATFAHAAERHEYP